MHLTCNDIVTRWFAFRQKALEAFKANQNVLFMFQADVEDNVPVMFKTTVILSNKQLGCLDCHTHKTA